MKCDFVLLYEKQGRYMHQCIRCKETIGWTPTRVNPYRQCRKKGLGDRVEYIIRKLGFRPRCGGCQKRKDRLNEFDRLWYRRLRGPRDGKTYST